MKRATNIVLAVTTALSAILLMSNGLVSGPFRGALGWGLFATSVLLATVRLIVSEHFIGYATRLIAYWTRRLKRSTEALPIMSPESLVFAKGLEADWVANNGKESTGRLYVNMSTPWRRTLRTSEYVSLEHHSYKQTTSSLIAVRDISDENDELHLPVLRIRKSRTVHALKVEIDGKRASTLTYRENCGAMLRILSNLYTKVFAHRPSYVYGQDPVWEMIVACLLYDGRVPNSFTSKVIAALENSYSSRPSQLAFDLESPGGAPSEDEISTSSEVAKWLERLEAMIRFVSSTYCVIATASDLAKSDRARVVTERNVKRSYYKSRLIDRMVIGIGLSVRKYAIPLPGALDSVSYHMEGTCTEGLYVYRQSFWLDIRGSLPPSGDVVDSASMNTEEPEELLEKVDLGDLAGTEAFHFYARDLEGYRRASRKIEKFGGLALPIGVIELRERPPGLLAPVGVLALYICALVWVTGYNYSALFKPAADGVVSGSSPWTTVLFGLPALMAGWALSRVEPAVLSRISLATLAATLACVASAGTTFAYVALRQSIALNEQVHIHGWTLTHPIWVLLMVATGMNLIFVSVMFISRSSRYIDRLANA